MLPKACSGACVRMRFCVCIAKWSWRTCPYLLILSLMLFIVLWYTMFMIIYIRRQQTGEEHAVVAQHNPWFDWSSIRGGSGNATTCCLGAGEYSNTCTRHKYTHIHTHSVGVIRIWRLAAQCNLSANHEENKRLSRAAGLIDALSTLLLSTDDDAVRVCFRLHVCNCICV